MSDWILWRQLPLKQKLGLYLRIVRLPIIAYGIFTIGYRQGIIDSHRNPYKFQEQILDTILLERTRYEVDRQDIDVLVITEDDLKNRKQQKLVKTNRYYQVASIANQIITAARQYVDVALEDAKETVRKREMKNLELSIDPSSLKAGSVYKEKLDYYFEAAYDKDREVQKWREAKIRINGDDLNVDPWRFIFLGSGAYPNAWVTELLPKRIFVTQSLLDFCANVDEVAFVLSHETSHLILGHLSHANDLELSLKTTEIVLLSLDPTAGLVTFVVVGLLSLLRRVVELAYSREHEREADLLALELLQRCRNFDPEAGAKFMFRMHQIQEEGGKTGWLDSHPASLERARQIYSESRAMKERQSR